jgi:uncharacterized protein
MPTDSNVSTPMKARDHARAQGSTVVRAMPTIPASAAKDLPAGVNAKDVVWDETLDVGDYCARVLKVGTRLRLINLEGDACANLLAYNADRPIERINVADTIKVQWNAYLGKGKLILSDMGRVLLSIIEDTCGNHDTLCGPSTEKSNARKFGQGENFSPYPSARDRFLLGLLKFGLGKKDIAPNINLFKGVRVDSGGVLQFIDRGSKPGDFIEFRAEMNVLIVVANTPHVLDPRTKYNSTPVRLVAYRGPATPQDDPVRNATPESLRAFQNTEDYFLS